MILFSERPLQKISEHLLFKEIQKFNSAVGSVDMQHAHVPVILDFPTQLAPTGSPSMVSSMKAVQNPVKTCDKVYSLIQSLIGQIQKRLEDPKSAG